MKYVVVTGGVMSGQGKGISSSCIGTLLKASGQHITSIKIDPYLNTDAGTMSPYEHGEVFVLDDGGEVDLDLGNYERFLNVTLTRNHNITTGKIYSKIISRERRGDYLGKTVQVIPHVTDMIQEWIKEVAYISVSEDRTTPDVCIIELGGTVGDIESMVYLEALRQLQYRVGNDNFCHVHVSLVPSVGQSEEPKSKPTQHAVRELRAYGLPPDIIFCRSSKRLDRNVINKISQFCMVPPTHVISVFDVSNIMRVPIQLFEQNVTSILLNHLHINCIIPYDIPNWRDLAERIDVQNDIVNIAMVGKYTSLKDAYLSVTKSLFYAGIHANRKVQVLWIESEDLEEKNRNTKIFYEAWNRLCSCDGIQIPGGFGKRGIEGMILASHYARNKQIPLQGICLGMQVAVIEYCRSKQNRKAANSSEIDPNCPDRVIEYMPEINPTIMGGTMRLGSRLTNIVPGSLAHYIYGRTMIHERHRHRYEVNPVYIDTIVKNDGIFSGYDERKQRMEIFELNDTHPFYLGVQFHPEFLSRPQEPSPPFLGLVQAASKQFNRKVRHTSFPAYMSKQPFTWGVKNEDLVYLQEQSNLTLNVLDDVESIEQTQQDQQQSPTSLAIANVSKLPKSQLSGVTANDIESSHIQGTPALDSTDTLLSNANSETSVSVSATEEEVQHNTITQQNRSGTSMKISNDGIISEQSHIDHLQHQKNHQTRQQYMNVPQKTTLDNTGNDSLTNSYVPNSLFLPDEFLHEKNTGTSETFENKNSKVQKDDAVNSDSIISVKDDKTLVRNDETIEPIV